MLQFRSMTTGLAVGITAAVVAACAAGAYVYSTHHMETLLHTARNTALAEGELIRVALEHQMIENDRTLIRRMVESFGKQPRVLRVVVLDRSGAPKYSSASHTEADEFRIESPTCQACHRLPPDQRSSSQVIETRGGRVLRTVVPVRNQPECHGCHDPNHRINGILILDQNTDDTRAAIDRDMRWMIAITAALTFVLVFAIALVIRVFVVRRLQRFETTARLIAGGNFDQRLPAEGADTLAWLAREFNSMADSLTGLVSDVRSERERMETVINSVDDGIVVLDPERKVIAANEAFVQRAGESRERMLGSCCRSFAPVGCNEADCPTLGCLRSGERQVRVCERRSRDGRVAWEEVHASPILDASRKVVYVVEVWRDISERRAAEARLAESHRLASLGLLASGFSHELNTPLATVLTCVEGILRETPSEQLRDMDCSRIRENASIAREQVLRCRGVTQNFLRMSRGTRSAGVAIDISECIASVRKLVEPTARSQSVRVDVLPIPDGLFVRGDESELQNVLINLILNAIQACKPGGQVVLKATAGTALHLSVADNGRGIAPENLKRIFEPFFSLSEGGTGLGLFLSLETTRRWGGDILVTSTEAGGATFEVVLPLLESKVEDAAAV